MSAPASSAPRPRRPHRQPDLLLGLADPLHPLHAGVLLEASITGRNGRFLALFTPPGTDTVQSIDLTLLGDTWAELHPCGWSVRAFTPGSPGHLVWQIAEAQHRIAQLVNAKPIQDIETAATITALATTLQQLVRRHALLPMPTPGSAAA